MADKQLWEVTPVATDVKNDDGVIIGGQTAGTRYAPLTLIANYVHNLWAAFINAITPLKTSFASGDKIPVVNGSTATAMPKDTLLELTAQNALGSIHSLSGTATEADLVSGNYLALDGSAGTKKLSADKLLSPKQYYSDEKAAEVGLSIELSGNGINSVTSKNFRVKPNTLYRVDVSNPSWGVTSLDLNTYQKLAIQGIADDGTETRLSSQYFKNTWVAPSIYFNSGDYSLCNIFFRADVGESVTFSLVPIGNYTLGSAFTLNIDLFGHGQNQVIQKFKAVKGLQISVVPSKTAWNVSTISSVSYKFIVQYYDSNNTAHDIKSYGKSATIPGIIYVDVPSDAVDMALFFRADEGESVTFKVDVSQKIDQASIESKITEISKVEIDTLLEQKSITLEGEGSSGDELYSLPILYGYNYLLSISDPNWSVSSLGSTQAKFILCYVKSDGTKVNIVNAMRDSKISKEYFIPVTSNDYVAIEIYFRADVGTDVVFSYSILPPSEAPLNKVSFVGRSGTNYVERIIPVSKPGKYSLYIGDDWTCSLGETYTKLGIEVNYADGTNVTQVTFFAGDVVPSKFDVFVPAGAYGIRLVWRGDEGQDKIIYLGSEFYLDSNISDNDLKSLHLNRYRRAKKNFQYLVLTDTHNAPLSGYFVRALNNIGSLVDCVLLCGDMRADNARVAGSLSQYARFFGNKTKTPILPVIGNHDVGAGVYVGNFAPLSQVLNEIMQPAVDEGWIPVNPGYYKVDFANSKTRVIVLNQACGEGIYDAYSRWERVTYDSSKPDIALSTSYSVDDVVNIPNWTDYSYRCTENLTTPANYPTALTHDMPCYSRRPSMLLINLDATQAQWLADTLLATPQGYSVVIASHGAYSLNSVYNDELKFSINGYTNTSDADILAGESDFVSDVIQAFNSGANYSNVIDNGYTTFSVSCDFRNKNSGTKVVSLVGGHTHKDQVLVHNVTKRKQVISSTASINYANTDIYLGATTKGVWNFSLTAISVDAVNDAVNVIKIGSKLTDDGYLRDCERLENN